MFVLTIVLNKKEYLQDVLSALMKQGVRGATIIDSKGMAGAVVHGDMRSIPMFGSLMKYVDGAHPYNTTIFSVISGEDLLKSALNAVNDVFGNTTKPGTGFMFTVPVNGIYGLGHN